MWVYDWMCWWILFDTLMHLTVFESDSLCQGRDPVFLEEILLFSKQDSTSAAFLRSRDLNSCYQTIWKTWVFPSCDSPHAVTCLKMCCTLATKWRVNGPLMVYWETQCRFQAILTSVVSVSTGPCRHIWTGGTCWEWNLWSSIQGKTLSPHATPGKLSKWPVIILSLQSHSTAEAG